MRNTARLFSTKKKKEYGCGDKSELSASPGFLESIPFNVVLLSGRVLFSQCSRINHWYVFLKWDQEISLPNVYFLASRAWVLRDNFVSRHLQRESKTITMLSAILGETSDNRSPLNVSLNSIRIFFLSSPSRSFSYIFLLATYFLSLSLICSCSSVDWTSIIV